MPSSDNHRENFKNESVTFVETQDIKEGVQCDIYTFDGDDSKDLGIVRVAAGSKTPLQRVLKGDKTIEGYVSGKGTLTITDKDNNDTVYRYDGEGTTPTEVIVEVGECMQWHADGDSELVFSEVCFPPYEDGRYKNLA